MILLKKKNKNDIKTIEGQNAQIEGANITDFELEGDTLQNDTPSPDTPVEIQSVTGLQNINVCGKNLFDTSNAESRTHNGITFTLNNDGSIKANGTASSLAFMLVLSQEQSPLYKAGDYAFSLSNEMPNNCYVRFEFYDSNNTMILRKDITTNGTATLLQNCYLKVSYVIASGTVLNNFVNYIQIEKGSTATEYEPYKGNTYEVNLGKNLFDKNNITTGKRLYYWQGTADLIDDANYCVSDYIKIKPNTIYTINLTMSAYARMIFFDNNKSPLSANETNATFTTPNNTAYVRLSVPLNQLDTTQLEKGSQATSYSPYFTPIELNKIGDYQDSIKKSTGKNLFDKTAITSSKIISPNTGNTSTNNDYGASDYIPVKANVSYYQANTNTYYGAFYNKNKEYVSATQNQRVITPSVDGYVRISGLLTNMDIIQLVEGDTAPTTYEPYGKVWYVEKNTRKLELAIADMNNNENFPGWNNQTQLKNDWPNINTQYLYNTGFKYLSSISVQPSSGYDTLGMNTASGSSSIYLNKNHFNLTQTQWKEQYLDLVVTIMYGIQTSETTEITNEELINQLEEISKAKLLHGENNIMITASDLVGDFKISYSDWYKFEKILRSGYNIKEDYDRINQKFINGGRKQILSDYEDCIIRLSLGTFDLETTVEYLKMLEDGEYEYYSFNDRDYKRADFLLEERPEIIVANSLKEDEAEIEDFEVTLLKAGE